MDTTIDLAAILAAHAAWLRCEPGGVRANLRGANLYGANLTWANLRGADLTEAGLRGANLTRADLTEAGLRGANLSGAYLAWADLYGADLYGANLAGANLYGANLAGANLRGANLYGANLRGANLVGANLAGANLRGANLSGANFTGAHGVEWGQIGPVGQGRRLISAWAHESLPDPVIAGGCFRGTFAEFRAKVTDPNKLPWDWGSGTTEEVERWRAECLAAADLLELAVSR